MNYSVDEVPLSLYQSAQQIKRIISPFKRNDIETEGILNQKIWIPFDLINSLISQNQEQEQESEREGKEEYFQLFNNNSSQLLQSHEEKEIEEEEDHSHKLSSAIPIIFKDILQTSIEEYCIIRIWRKDKIQSTIIL